MNNLIIVLSFLLCVACDQPDGIERLKEFKIIATKGGELWEAHSNLEALTDNSDYVVLTGHKDQDHSVYITFKIGKTGLAEVMVENTGYRETIGGDVLKKEFLPGSAIVVITEYDNAENVIGGEFQLELEEKSSNDVARFSAGKFRARMVQ